jgi:hypothetical protein
MVHYWKFKKVYVGIKSQISFDTWLVGVGTRRAPRLQILLVYIPLRLLI